MAIMLYQATVTPESLIGCNVEWVLQNTRNSVGAYLVKSAADNVRHVLLVYLSSLTLTSNFTERARVSLCNFSLIHTWGIVTNISPVYQLIEIYFVY